MLFVGTDPETQRCVAPVRPRLVGWAAPFRAVPPSGHAVALGNGRELRLRLCFARHVGTRRRAFRRQFQFLGAGILICAFLSCCVHVSFYSTIFSSHLPLDWSVVVICWTATTVLCEPFVPYSLLEFWFSKFGGSCPSGSHKIQHSAPPSATVVLDSTDFFAGKGIARCATKRATVMLWKLRSSLFFYLCRDTFHHQGRWSAAGLFH